MFSAILNDGFLNAAIVWTLSELMHHVTRLKNHGGGLQMGLDDSSMFPQL